MNEHEQHRLFQELSELSRGVFDLPEGGWTVERVAAPRRARCKYCDAVLSQNRRGRPQIICGAPECERKRSAAQKRREYKRSLGRTYHEGNGERYTNGSKPVADLPPAETGLQKIYGKSDKHTRKHNPVTVRYLDRP